MKRSLLTDGRGMPLSIAAAGANTNDHKLMRETIEGIVTERPAPSAEARQHLCLDKGYDYDEVRAIVKEFGFTAHIRARGEEAKAIKREAGFRARRWMVERTHSWMNRFRRILVRWEKLPETFIAMLHLTCGIMSSTLQDGRRHVQLPSRSPHGQACHVLQITRGHVPGRASQSLSIPPRPSKPGEHALTQARPLELRDHREELRL